MINHVVRAFGRYFGKYNSTFGFLYKSKYYRSSYVLRFYCSEGNMAMADLPREGMPLKDVVAKLNTFASLTFAESWDNVGLLVEPYTPIIVKNILLTNDLTEDVMREALERNANLIISYHPPIFQALKSITMQSWKERIIACCLENKIAVYSPHTGFDVVKGGVNDWLARAFAPEYVRPIIQTYMSVDPPNSHRLEVIFPNTETGKCDSQSFCNIAEGLKAEDGTPLIRTLFCSGDNDTHVTCVCNSTSVPLLVQKIQNSQIANGYSQVRVIERGKAPVPGFGMGRLCTLKVPLPVNKIVNLVKNHLEISHVQLALAYGKGQDSLVSTIALCAGSGTTILKGVNADLYFTGEMSHHEVLDAVHKGRHVILCNHSNSERGFLRVFAPALTEMLEQKVHVSVSWVDKDPLVTV